MTPDMPGDGDCSRPLCTICAKAVKVPRRGMCRACHIADLTARRARGAIDGRVRRDLLARIAEYVDTDGECWLWTGQLNNKGYGLFSIRDQKRAAHRVVWEVAVGPIPDGLQIDHLCRVRSCVNPDHLDPVTASVNQLRSYASRRLERQP